VEGDLLITVPVAPAALRFIIAWAKRGGGVCVVSTYLLRIIGRLQDEEGWEAIKHTDSWPRGLRFLASTFWKLDL
jgi:hypothetical protein